MDITSFVPVKEMVFRSQGALLAAFCAAIPLQSPFQGPPSEESLEASFHIRQRATPMCPYQAHVPYFSFLRLTLAICLSIIYPLTHFREQGTVMQLNSKKHKQGRLPLHISFAKLTNASLRPLQGTHLFGISIKRYLLFVIFQQNFSGVGIWNPLWLPLTVDLGWAGLGPGFGLPSRPPGSLASCRQQDPPQNSLCQESRLFPLFCELWFNWCILPHGLFLLNGLIHLRAEQSWCLLARAKPLRLNRIGEGQVSPVLFLAWWPWRWTVPSWDPTSISIKRRRKSSPITCDNQASGTQWHNVCKRALASLSSLATGRGREVKDKNESSGGQSVLCIPRGRCLWKALFVAPSDSCLAVSREMEFPS